jgi:hypothetical protein
VRDGFETGSTTTFRLRWITEVEHPYEMEDPASDSQADLRGRRDGEQVVWGAPSDCLRSCGVEQIADAAASVRLSEAVAVPGTGFGQLDDNNVSTGAESRPAKSCKTNVRRSRGAAGSSSRSSSAISPLQISCCRRPYPQVRAHVPRPLLLPPLGTRGWTLRYPPLARRFPLTTPDA